MTAVATAPDLVPVDSAVLGPVAVPASAIFRFADGVHGFPGHTRFALLPAQREGLFWLQSTLDATVTFLLVDPFAIHPGYAVDLGPTEKVALDVQQAEDVLLLAIVTLPGTPDATPTANLRAPVVLNLHAQRGRQVVTTDDRYGMHAPADIRALAPRAHV